MTARKLADEIRMTKPFRLPELEAYLNLARTYDQLHGEFNELFREYGLTQQQYNVLRILRGAGEEGLPSLEVAHRMVTRVPDVTRLVDRMERSDLVTRQRCDRDRRVVRIRLTAKGRDLADRLEGPTDAFHREQLGHLSGEELDTLNRLLEKIRARPDR
ncbi:MAG TPA: MarR family winged helix-turn-helix transcriptional regulator [Candidatus Krumholzibacteria bacterium]|nr:MarR family winged helix-turn-helix transcriptional regulator [Candidatus Krumholzibacteria bacterium]